LRWIKDLWELMADRRVLLKDEWESKKVEFRRLLSVLEDFRAAYVKNVAVRKAKLNNRKAIIKALTEEYGKMEHIPKSKLPAELDNVANISIMLYSGLKKSLTFLPDLIDTLWETYPVGIMMVFFFFSFCFPLFFFRKVF